MSFILHYSHLRFSWKISPGWPMLIYTYQPLTKMLELGSLASVAIPRVDFDVFIAFSYTFARFVEQFNVIPLA